MNLLGQKVDMEDRGVHVRLPKDRRKKGTSKYKVVLGKVEVREEKAKGNETKRSHTEYDVENPDTYRSHNFVKVG